MKDKYIIISPVRNEEDYLEKTIQSVIKQSILPLEWILVDDGSTDRTAPIIKSYQKDFPWIKLISVTDRGFYYPGKGVVDAFYKGYNSIENKNWEFVVKLDCDLEFESDYFESLFVNFHDNPKLGIASGIPYIPYNGKFVREPVVKDHAVGPSKVYKKECWESIGGLKPVSGWDLADVLQAQMNGWETRCFYELRIKHFRLTGARRNGIWAPKHLQGRFEYRHGYSFGYAFLKSIRHLFSKPYIIGSLAKISGYIYAALNKEEYIFDEKMRRYLRKKHKNFLLKKLGMK